MSKAKQKAVQPTNDGLRERMRVDRLAREVELLKRIAAHRLELKTLRRPIDSGGPMEQARAFIAAGRAFEAKKKLKADAEKSMSQQAEDLMRNAGYVDLGDGNFVLPHNTRKPSVLTDAGEV